LGWENSCHLRGPMQLIQTQFPRFAGILGIRRRRHGDQAQTPHPGSAGEESKAGEGEGDTVFGGRLSSRPRPSRRPSESRPARARTLTRLRPFALRLPPHLFQGPGSWLDFVPSAVPAQTAAPAAAAAAMARALGPYVTSVCPSTPPAPSPAGGDVTGHSRHGWDATWTPKFPRPRNAPAPCEEPASQESRATWGPRPPPSDQHSRAANDRSHRSIPGVPTPGPPLQRAEPETARTPWRGRRARGRGHLPHSASPRVSPPPKFSVTPSLGFRGKKSCKDPPPL
jgi:hypothetical protein